MQNKPNSQNYKTNATSYIPKSYRNIPLRRRQKKQTQSNPISPQDTIRLPRGGNTKNKPNLILPNNPASSIQYRASSVSSRVRRLSSVIRPLSSVICHPQLAHSRQLRYNPAFAGSFVFVTQLLGVYCYVKVGSLS